jgi:hypothetical protein
MELSALEKTFQGGFGEHFGGLGEWFGRLAKEGGGSWGWIGCGADGMGTGKLGIDDWKLIWKRCVDCRRRQ